MTGKHSTKNKTNMAVLPDPASTQMPDPDNLQVDLSKLPLTGPITLPLPRR